MTARTSLVSGFLLLSSVAVCGCGMGTRAEGDSKGAEELAANAIAALPNDVPHRTFVDFGGKLHLVGYDVSPESSASPGSTVRLKLYWKPVSRLDPGWNLFTHLEDDGAHQLWNFDREGAFRALLGSKMPAGLSLLEPGKIYVDEQTLTMPRADQLAPYVNIVVGVWQGDMRLPIVSGASNGHEGAVVARVSTGIQRQQLQKVLNPRPR